ncbi:MAG TPA: XRE family transcriptional regulator [Firmicutes bacterium]|jgi:DNA-binding Xre family transcriptional regulator|nr:XRE family transcriptional regulator [Bacillota bacterium]
MISYAPLWKTMERKGFTTYTLRYKHGIGGGTIQRMQKNETISTNTLDILCRVLSCTLPDVAEYIPNEPTGE